MDISGRQYYKDLKKQKSSISKVLFDEEEGTESIIIGVPMIQQGRFEGAICLEYSTMELGRLLNGKDTSGMGAVLVFTRKGRMVASYEGMEKFPTMYDMLKTMVRAVKSA